MRVDLIAPEEWEARQDLLRREFFPATTETWTPAPGAAAAVFENVLGLAQIYSHKRSVAFIHGNSPVFDSVVSWFLREAYQVQKKSVADFANDEAALVAWFDGLKKDTVMILLAEDHPVTGELLPWDEIDRVANDRKIFVVRVSHQAHRTDRPVLRPYSSRICSVRSDLALVGCGARFRVHPVFSQRWGWLGGDLAEVLRNEFGGPAVALEQVLAFEGLFPEANLLAGVNRRLADRAVLSFVDVSGEALRAELLNHGVSGVETADLCRWNSMKIHREWWKQAPSDERLRGLVLLPAALLSQTIGGESLEAVLRRSLANVRSRQEWT